MSDLRKAIRVYHNAERKLTTAMIAAYDAGYSLQRISIVSDLAEERVRSLIAAELVRITQLEDQLRELARIRSAPLSGEA